MPEQWFVDEQRDTWRLVRGVPTSIVRGEQFATFINADGATRRRISIGSLWTWEDFIEHEDGEDWKR